MEARDVTKHPTMHRIAPNHKKLSHPKCWNSVKVEKAWRDIWWEEGGLLIKSPSWGHRYKRHGMILLSYQKTILSGEVNFPLNIMWDSRKPSRSVKDFSRLSWKYEITKLPYQTEFANPQAVSLIFFLEGVREVVSSVYECGQCNPKTFCMASSARVTNFEKKGINENGRF